MKPNDFPQFDDPRVREVMAAAANLVEGIISGVFSQDDENESIYALKMALFAAQHSKPKTVEFDSVSGKDARGYTADDYNGRGGPGDR